MIQLQRNYTLSPVPNLEKDLEQLRHKLVDIDYARALYAALCNNEFIKDGEDWSCTWRYAGGIVARLRGLNENYLDFYLSGFNEGFPEGTITEEIKKDLESLGWS
jgi:hypothetical protein